MSLNTEIKKCPALVLYDQRMAAKHNLMNLIDTGVDQDRWAYNALRQVHVTHDVVDYDNDGELVPVFCITYEFFDPAKNVSVSCALAAPLVCSVC